MISNEALGLYSLEELEKLATDINLLIEYKRKLKARDISAKLSFGVKVVYTGRDKKAQGCSFTIMKVNKSMVRCVNDDTNAIWNLPMSHLALKDDETN